MEIFCTYCSKEKDELIDLLPAIHRYKSTRIRKVGESAKLLGFPLFILSGEYGLIPIDKEIVNYDHPLRMEEVDSLVLKSVMSVLTENHIKRVYFYMDSHDNNIEPYIEAISQACELTSVELILIEIEIGEEEKNDSPGFRKIWYAALEKNAEMVKNNDNTAKTFDNLIDKYPNDGMVFYERGEAFESLRDFHNAKKDFERALMYFPNPKWKKVAYEGLKRCMLSSAPLSDAIIIDPSWDYFHKVHSYVYLPHIIRVNVLSAIERFQEEHRIAVGEMRISLEMIIIQLAKSFKTIDGSFYEDLNIRKKLDDLEAAGCGSYEFIESIRKSYKKMSDIIHPISGVEVSDFTYKNAIYKNAFESFMKILEICNDKKYLVGF